jgi:DNA repair exonuclease SbcCD nuclease subunit
MLRFVHTSDLHLGDRWADGRAALEGVVDLAQLVQADAIVMAGDVFDDNRVGDDEVQNLLQEIRRFERPVFVLPGNHDPYDASSVYLRTSLPDRPRNLLLLTDVSTPISVQGLDLQVWGSPTVDHTPSFHPLRQVPERTRSGWYVVVAHGFVVQRPEDYMRSSPILAEEISKAACDYIALGHIDLFRDVTQGHAPAVYSGSPRTLNGKRGTAVVVEFDASGASFEARTIV